MGERKVSESVITILNCIIKIERVSENLQNNDKIRKMYVCQSHHTLVCPSVRVKRIKLFCVILCIVVFYCVYLSVCCCVIIV